MSDSKKILILENLPLGITSSELTGMLTPLGQVSWSYIKNPEDGRLNQTAYVEMATEKEASKIIVKWNGADVKNHILRVKYVPPNFDRATMGEDWRKAKPPSPKSRNSKVELETLEEKSEPPNKSDDLLATSSSSRTANKTVQYNRKDLVVLKPGLDLNSNYDKPHNILPTPAKTEVISHEEIKIVWFKNPFTWFVAMFIIVAIVAIAYAVYFIWNKI